MLLFQSKYHTQHPSITTNTEFLRWKKIEEFKNKSKILEKICVPHLPKHYKDYKSLITTCKYSYRFSPCERLARTLLGLALVILTLGIILIFKPVRHLFRKDHFSVKIVKPNWEA